jgi:hypothetical protein
MKNDLYSSGFDANSFSFNVRSGLYGLNSAEELNDLARFIISSDVHYIPFNDVLRFVGTFGLVPLSYLESLGSNNPHFAARLIDKLGYKFARAHKSSSGCTPIRLVDVVIPRPNAGGNLVVRLVTRLQVAGSAPACLLNIGSMHEVEGDAYYSRKGSIVYKLKPTRISNAVSGRAKQLSGLLGALRPKPKAKPGG